MSRILDAIKNAQVDVLDDGVAEIRFGVAGPDPDRPERPAPEKQAQQAAFRLSDLESPVGAGERFMAGIKLTDEGKLGFLRAQRFKKLIELNPGIDRDEATRMAQDSVQPVVGDEGGIENFLVRDAQGDFRLFDPQGGIFSTTDIVGDVADIGADILESVPGMAGAAAGATGGSIVPGAGTAAGAVTGGAIGEAVGQGARQAISAILEGDDNLSAKDRAIMLGFAAGTGALGEGVGIAAKKAVKFMRPGASASRLADDIMSHQKKKPAAALANSSADEAIESGTKPIGEAFRNVGVEPDLADITGAPSIRAQREALRQMPATRDVMAANEAKKIEQLGASLDRMIRETPTSAGDSGRFIAKAYSEYRDQLVRQRAESASVYFGRAKNLLGDTPVVGTRNLRAALESLKSGSEALVTTQGTTEKIVSNADRLLKQIESRENRATITQIQNSLADFGRSASGAGRATDELDIASDKRFARVIFGALQDDLDEAATEAASGTIKRDFQGRFMNPQIQQAAQALQNARRVYSEMSEKITASESGLLEKAVNLTSKDQEEKFARVLLSAEPNEIRRAITIGKEASPESVAKMRSSVLDEIFQKTSARNLDAATGAVNPSPAMLASELSRSMSKLKALFADKPASLALLKDMQRVARSMSTRELGSQGSQTAPVMMMAKALGFTLPFVGDKIETAFAQIGQKRMARLMIDPKAINKIRKAAAAYRRGATQASVRMLTSAIAANSRHDWIFDQEPERQMAIEENRQFIERNPEGFQ